ncbi:hypothetical protein ACFO4E_24580 [Nocardiopsis mangrovi]|uniref:Uncharacterized protein n=1 Tax=Nocardiopsis mangrovi TaxID=1179818 RepID=A0ABV9E1K3_9ACTN
MANFQRLLAVGAGALVLATGISAPAAASHITAEDSFRFSFTENSNGAVINVNNNTMFESAGNVIWRQDPSGGRPGDALYAGDILADGYGIEGRLSTNPERVASTRGHNSPYSVTVTGNLPEGNTYWLRACVVRGSFEVCSAAHEVTA